MIDKVGVVALLLAVALSGCTSDDGPPALTEEDCAALGQVLSTGEEEHTHGEGDHGDGEAHEPECVDPEPEGPRGIVTVNEVPAEVSKYSMHELSWTLGTQNENGKDHAMDTRLIISTELLSNPISMPDDFGTTLSKLTHQNYDHGTVYSVEYSFQEEGTFYLYGFGLIGSVNTWSEPKMVTVGPVLPTGTVHAVTVSGFGPAAAIEKCSLNAVVGDAVKFINDDLLPRTFTGTRFSETVDGQGGESAEILFVEPGNVSYTSTTDLSPIGDLSCSINVIG